MSIAPTVGRVIWYYPGEQDPATTNGNDPLDAHIIAVWPDGTVNLMIFDIKGYSFHRENVVIVQDGDVTQKAPKPTEGYAAWMPYQVGQAAKTEELEKEVKGKKSSK